VGKVGYAAVKEVE